MSEKPVSVLLIEDNPGDARLIREMLAAAPGGFILAEADGLSAGLALLEGGRHDVVLLDLGLPETQGIETFNHVRTCVPGTPIVVLTGCDDEALAAEALQTGAQDYLVKGQTDERALARSLRYALERARIEEQLRLHAAELADAARRKDEFLAILAHELRNPLSTIAMTVELLQQPDATPEEHELAQTTIRRQVGHMKRLIDDLLDVSRLTLGKIELRRQRISLTAEVKRCVEALKQTGKSLEHDLQLALAADPLVMDADPDRIEQVITNLVSNAIRYTDPGGRIEVSTWREGSDALLSVRDTGVGIPPEMLERVFDMFTQVDRAYDRSRQWGLGVGLALVHGLVTLHGGSIRALSEGVGKGSEFLLRLPLSCESVLITEPERVAQDDLPMTPPRRVLIAEDHAESAQVLARLLRQWGHVVEVANDGPTALAAARRLRPDIAVIDIGLPLMDGYRVAQAIRGDPRLADTVLIALTGYGSQQDRLRAREAGFMRHLVKPVDLALLRATMTACMSEPDASAPTTWQRAE